MAMPERSSHINPSRQRSVNRLASRIQRAIELDPFLLRLPSEAQLAELCESSVREVRYAILQLERAGYVQRTGRAHGVRVIFRRPVATRLQRIILVGIQGPGPLSTFFERVCIGVDGFCRENKLTCEQVSFPQADWERRLDEAVASPEMADAGWLPERPPSEALICRWAEEQRRIVLVDPLVRHLPQKSVQLDYDGAVTRAVDHLRQLGHERISSLYSAGSQAAFFLGRCTDAARSWPIPGGTADSRLARVRLWMESWIADAEPVTAIIVHNLIYAEYLLKFLRGRGIRVPGDISLVGLGCMGDRIEEHFTFVSTGEAEQLGRWAAELLSTSHLPHMPQTMAAVAELHNPNVTTAPPAARS